MERLLVSLATFCKAAWCSGKQDRAETTRQIQKGPVHQVHHLQNVWHHSPILAQVPRHFSRRFFVSSSSFWALSLPASNKQFQISPRRPRCEGWDFDWTYDLYGSVRHYLAIETPASLHPLAVPVTFAAAPSQVLTMPGHWKQRKNMHQNMHHQSLTFCMDLVLGRRSPGAMPLASWDNLSMLEVLCRRLTTCSGSLRSKHLHHWGVVALCRGWNRRFGSTTTLGQREWKSESSYFYHIFQNCVPWEVWLMCFQHHNLEESGCDQKHARTLLGWWSRLCWHSEMEGQQSCLWHHSCSMSHHITPASSSF